MIAGLAARILVTLKPDIYHAVYHNQRHVLGAEAPEAQVRRHVYQVFFGAARAYYELFHNVGRGRTQVREFDPPVYLTSAASEHLRQALAAGRGVFVLGCHVSNFDLAGISLCQSVPEPVQVLSLADPAPGFELFNELRRQAGALVTPISPESLRTALLRLRKGGIVLTGVDRPIGENDQPVEFFGATAYLPTGYIRIPLRTDCLVLTAGAAYENGAYHIHVNPPLEMVRSGDREEDVRINVRRVLAELEAFISRHPEQWMMFVPVWKPPGG
ncbi:MAG: lysophospholipid acyltransferase family protein [Anaerolineae bacterium]